MKTATTYDTHVACQGINASLHDTLLDLGFQDDGLVGRYVSMVDGVSVSSCPLIGIHMSKKTNARDQSLHTLDQTRNLLEHYKMVGYGHSEVTLSREILSGNEHIDATVEPNFLPLQLSTSDVNKKWDVHIAIPHTNLNEELRQVMEKYGFDWIDLQKKDGNVNRVYSAQGICSLDVGKRLYAEVVDWLRDMNVPSAKIKLERYVGMYRIGNPEIVPPVVDKVVFL